MKLRNQVRGSIAACAAAAVAAAPAAADTFVPTRLDDPPPNKCKPADCSLREAVRAANNRFGADTILLGEGNYQLQRPPTDTGGTTDDGQLFSVDNLLVRGRGPRETAIDANDLDRVFAVGGDRTTLEGLTLKDGDAGTDPTHTDVGGALLAIGNKVVLRNVAVRSSTAQLGGAIKAASPQLTIKNSTIAGNVGQEGGAIDIRAGFIQNTISVRSSTISGNAAVNGGGIMADGTANASQTAPIVNFDNSTIAGNFASASAGGVAGGQNAIVILDNTTVAYNRADVDSFGGGNGGGIHEQNASFQFNDSVLALNTVGSTGSGPACHGEFEDGGSLVDTTGSNPNCNFVGLVQPSVTTTPLIGPLADNGGPTKTVKLLSGSPAVGLSLGCPNLDQRGKDRPEEDCDAGSFERNGP